MSIQIDDTLSLELMVVRHAAPMLELVNANRAHLREWLSWVDNMQTVEQFRQFITNAQQRVAFGSDYAFVIIFNNEIVGRIGIYNIDKNNKLGAIGYWLGSAYEGKGIITRACKAMLEYGFLTLDLNRMEIKCGTENYKSQGIPERLHFTKEGIVRQGEWVNGRCIDLFSYSLLKAEWEQQRQ
jgi:ribosomal-protein-serine acetyltransferase